MKVTIGEAEKDFKPIQLEITIESMNELLDLYHRVNMTHERFYTKGVYTSNDSDFKLPTSKGVSDVFHKLYVILDKRRGQ